MRYITALVIVMLATRILSAQPVRNEMNVPDIPGYITLKGDFHIHTVFSDGDVWPVTRVQEAWMEGLDVISITDHLEYTPHKDYIPVNHEAPYSIARKTADELGILLIKGTEVTKSMPPGHYNALFVREATPLHNENYREALNEAKSQGAFVLWNHPGWRAQTPDGPVWMKEHEELFSQGLFQGIEVGNYDEWYPEVLDWAISRNLTIFCNSDIHEPMHLYFHRNKMKRRPVTLVFAETATETAVREALNSGRTAGWFNEYVFARKEILQSLLKESVRATEIARDQKNVRYRLHNSTDFEFNMTFSNLPSEKIHLPERSSVQVSLPLNQDEVTVSVLNFLHGSEAPLTFPLGLFQK